MKSVRLTKDLRQRILESYVTCYDASNPAPQQYTEKSIINVFAEILRKRIFDKHNVDETAIPNEFLKQSRYIGVVFPDNTYTSLYFYNEDGTNTVYKPLPSLDGAIRIEDNDLAYIQYKESKRKVKELNKAYEEYTEKRSFTISQVRMALDSVNTTGQLLSVWPEAEQFIPSDVLDFSKINLPSVSFNDLNKAVGI